MHIRPAPAALTACAVAVGLALGGCSDPGLPGGESSTHEGARPDPAGGFGEWIAYGDDPRQRVTLWPGEPGGGLLVAVHGGGWVAGSATGYVTEGNAMHDLLARAHEEGWWVAAAEYRYTDEAPWPATAEDVHTAVRTAGQEAREAGAGETVVLLGESAGGHLVALEGVEHPDEVDAVVSFYGMHDLTTPVQQRAATGCEPMEVGAPQIFGGEPETEAEQERALAASPAHRIGPGAPELLLLHGTADCVVPHAQSVQLQEAAERHDVPVELVTLEGLGHGGDDFWRDPAVTGAVSELLAAHAGEPEDAPSPGGAPGRADD
ncbi:alpha/beta hydrolase fold [Kytococcus aerolatus]|uniref:Alpha/beta hydrolase fold n=1 Tax=Kytococcus aerolatus TaxID=592308 RepID=A0A212TGP9_9MICO|nr:alpha/beta hydrolase [Kytococcus aerolatus]SNC64996.1 alpha/beta hydrolase fold [Kytococcus aerolatus]